MTLQVPAVVHTIFEAVAFFIGFRYYVYLKKREGDTIPMMNRIWIIVGAACGALIGSRLIGAFENPGWMSNPSFINVFAAFNNKTIIGGLYGGLLGVEITK